jgi:hypothetical protein
MSGVKRTLLAYAVGIAVLLPAAAVGESLGVSGWGDTGIAVAVMFLISFIDREGFYGPREPGSG